MDDIDEEFKELMDFFNGMAPRGTFANELQAEVSKVKASQEWRREYMTLQIFICINFMSGDEWKCLKILMNILKLSDIYK